MGIKNLSIILNQKCSCAINERNLTSYSGMVIGIDVSIFLYKYLYNNDDHIEGLTRFILRLYKNNIGGFGFAKRGSSSKRSKARNSRKYTRKCKK